MRYHVARYNNGTMELCSGPVDLSLEAHWFRVTLLGTPVNELTYFSFCSLLPPGNLSFLETVRAHARETNAIDVNTIYMQFDCNNRACKIRRLWIEARDLSIR